VRGDILSENKTLHALVHSIQFSPTIHAAFELIVPIAFSQCIWMSKVTFPADGTFDGSLMLILCSIIAFCTVDASLIFSTMAFETWPGRECIPQPLDKISQNEPFVASITLIPGMR
jgi:hypothetical protein